MTLIKLALRAALFGLLLWWVITAGFAFLPSLVFVIVAVVLYSQPMFNTMELSVSFVTLLSLAFFISAALSAGANAPLLWALGFGILFFILLGNKRVVFKHRMPWYTLVHLTLVYAVFLLFFSLQQPGWFVISSIALWAVLTMLLREFFHFARHAPSPRLRLVVNTLSFITVELVWAIGLLPIGFLNAAGIALTCFYLLEEALHAHVSAAWDKRAMTINIAIASVLMLVILRASQWTL